MAVDQGSLTISLGFGPDALARRTIYGDLPLPADHPQQRDRQPQLAELTGWTSPVPRVIAGPGF
ncbi:MAG: hypothetical protein M0Z53_11905 [Thermaerobacter sp.]|nr:hypothetical protein [Thermaerobacter sp.]